MFYGEWCLATTSVRFNKQVLDDRVSLAGFYANQADAVCRFPAQAQLRLESTKISYVLH